MARPRRSDDTRALLIEEGAADLLSHGYHGTGIKQVLDKVGVPKGSFYNYFDSKETFAQSVIEHHALCIQRNLADAFGSTDDPLVGVRTFFERQTAEFVRTDFTGGCLLANLAAELEGSDVLREELSTAWTGWRDGVAGALRAAQTAGSVRDDIDAVDLADLLLESWEGAVIRMKLQRTVEPLHKCLKRLLDDYFRP
ncbi:TetR family transcriptional regulator C-terminal domain-containing protein [Nocardia sp. NPDC058666]|uniref:TetR/AcrR family transcriptional regulator n=1 Tax=Nocardia sp. NPDC058666 TaxID=3346587 RepID=UPI00366864D5